LGQGRGSLFRRDEAAEYLRAGRALLCDIVVSREEQLVSGLAIHSSGATMSQRRVVMISSTARDLPQHREQVRLACLRAGFDPGEMMEHLTALDSDAIQTSLQMVESADVYLGVFAYRYGTIPIGYDISITEMEYNRAVELDKPRLIFFIHKDHPVVIEDVEAGVGADKLKALKDRIGEQRVAAFFKSPADLRAGIIEALTAPGMRLDAAGTGKSSATALHRITSIPAPPEPYIAHPYTLLQTVS
jgi:hypothetical protein